MTRIEKALATGLIACLAFNVYLLAQIRAADDYASAIDERLFEEASAREQADRALAGRASALEESVAGLERAVALRR